MRTPEREGTEQCKHSAGDASIEEEPSSHLSRELARKGQVQKPAERGVANEVEDDRDRCHSLETLFADTHGSGLTWIVLHSRPINSVKLLRISTERIKLHGRLSMIYRRFSSAHVFRIQLSVGLILRNACRPTRAVPATRANCQTAGSGTGWISKAS